VSGRAPENRNGEQHGLLVCEKHAAHPGNTPAPLPLTCRKTTFASTAAGSRKLLGRVCSQKNVWSFGGVAENRIAGLGVSFQGLPEEWQRQNP